MQAECIEMKMKPMYFHAELIFKILKEKIFFTSKKSEVQRVEATRPKVHKVHV